ncbi:MAG: biotin/lipoyl-binding protein [Bacteroidales bacterium]|nr:biotin/lipoyl-binding protein [Bacteroidales bacterium]
MKKYNFSIRGTNYTAEIQKAEGNIIEIEVNGTIYKVELEKTVKTNKTPKLMRSAVPPPQTREKKINKSLSSKITIKSPLPGIITKILVREGDVVKEGDTLLLMEAMKMENKIETEKAGIVKLIKVKEGDNVLQDDILVELS